MTKLWLPLLVIVFATCGSPTETSQQSLNRLASASSPYLKEHADNPVDWYEWGDEALQKAANEDKPIILSIGYASCHWCHVMEEESFMDTTVARIMNENFVSIKVDREERPDVDKIYIDAAQLISGHAGWPLNAFSLPDGKPFFAGTYFPKEQWINLLEQIVEAYRNDRSNVEKQAEAVTEGILENSLIKPAEDASKANFSSIYSDIFTSWEPDLDYASGGLAGAPKFPMPSVWEFLLQDYYRSKNPRELKAVITTLDAMASGGIYDQLEGGFARYSTDAEWKVPHFEKMLYDNAQLVSLYAHAYQLTGNQRYASTVEETLAFIVKELTSPAGGFYSSLNADSEGEEGTYYVWTLDEISRLLDKEELTLVVDHYNLSAEGNWESGKNVLSIDTSLPAIASAQGKSEADAAALLSGAKKKLLNAREKRIRPSLDDKILTSWNALMISGYVDSYWALGKQEYLEVALKNAAFIKNNMLSPDGHLWRAYADGKPSIDAFLDDYALLSLAFTNLYQATFDIQWLAAARTLADYAIEHFSDTTTGFFFYTAHESTELVGRKYEVSDQVIPSSNAVMAEVLFKLGHYFESGQYESMSLKMVASLSNEFVEGGPYFSKWASVMGMTVHKPYEVAIMGENARVFTRELMKTYQPSVLLMGGTAENLPLLESKYVDGETIIYVCQNKLCKLPVKRVELALKQLETN